MKKERTINRAIRESHPIFKRLWFLDIGDKELCERAGISTQSLGNWLCGRHMPTMQSLEKIAPRLGMKTTDLYDLCYEWYGVNKKESWNRINE